MRRNSSPTLEDVAREAGVTAMAASVVLNGARSSSRVSETTRVRITEAAARLRYRPNAVARSLSNRLMDTIGVMAVVDGGEINLYFLEVLNGILEAAREYGQNTTIFSILEWQKDESRILHYCDQRVDGMILIGPLLTPSFAATLPLHTPFVTIHGDRVLPHTSNLDVDDEQGAYAIVKYLIEIGHRRIAHFPGPLELGGAQRRLQGYLRALAEAGLPHDEALILPGHFSGYSGRVRMTEMLDQSGSRPLPTAIFCASDAIAFGCMEVLASRGIHIPEDISIAGFDDILTSRMTTPPLTTVKQPFRQMGRRAVELLLPEIRSDIAAASDGDTNSSIVSAPMGYRTEIFAVELVVRGSVGPPPNSPHPPAPSPTLREKGRGRRVNLP